MASLRCIDSSHIVWFNSAKVPVFIVTSSSISGTEVSFRILRRLSVAIANIDPTLAINFWVVEARRSCCLAFWSILSQISALTSGTIKLSQFSGLEYLSSFSFCLASLSFEDQRLVIMSASCWFMLDPTSSA